MDLFNNDIASNLLPFEGEANYYGKIIDYEKTDYYFNKLFQEIEWTNDKAIIFGKLIHTKRKVAWYGDKPFKYTYSKTTKQASPWTKELLELKEIIEAITGETFNACLLNLYHNGNEGMAWHSDAEKDLKKNGAIASLSLGTDRKFSFKHKKTKKSISIILERGSLLIMKGTTQTNWLHSLPTSKQVKSPRINLTFRKII